MAPEEQGQQESQEQQQSQGDGQQHQNAPFDPEALRSVMTDVMRDEFERRAAENAGQDRERQEQQQQEEQQRRQNRAEPTPLERVIAPIVAPAIQRSFLEAQGATDAALFYANNGDDAELRRKWSSEVEAKFNEQARNGRATPREDIFNWMIGGAKRTEYLDWAIKSRDKKARDAELAMDAGGGSSRMSGAGAKAPADMSEKELEDALKDGF